MASLYNSNSDFYRLQGSDCARRYNWDYRPRPTCECDTVWKHYPLLTTTVDQLMSQGSASFPGCDDSVLAAWLYVRYHELSINP